MATGRTTVVAAPTWGEDVAAVEDEDEALVDAELRGVAGTD
jgi:hypothetical protein